APDRLDRLRALAGEGLESDILVLSGGVSAGKLDLVPGVLQELGVQAHFHKVEMKPGKPVFFGTWAPAEKETTQQRKPSACHLVSSSVYPAPRSARWSVSSCSCARRFGGCAVMPTWGRGWCRQR